MNLVVKRGTYPSGSPYWKISGTLPTIGRVRQFFPEKKKARDFAADLEYRYCNVGELTEANACRVLLEPHGWSLRQATDYVLKHAIPHAQPPPVGQVVELFLEKYTERGRAKITFAEKRHRLRKFTAHFGNRYLHELKLKDYDDWKSRLAAVGYAPTGIRHFLTHASEFVGWCVPRGYCASNLLEHVDRPDLEPRRPAIFSVERAERLFAIAPRHDLLAWAVFGTLCGIRPGEMELLTMENYDATERNIIIDGDEFTPSQRRIIELEGAWGDAVAAWLQHCPSSGLIIPWPSRRQTEALRAELGFWSHDIMRHTAASAHYAYFADVGKTMKMLGHGRSADMFHTHYKAVMKRATAEALYALRPS